jgi:hypothetical protein
MEQYSVSPTLRIFVEHRRARLSDRVIAQHFVLLLLLLQQSAATGIRDGRDDSCFISFPSLLVFSRLEVSALECYEHIDTHQCMYMRGQVVGMHDRMVWLKSLDSNTKREGKNKF